MTGIVLAVLSAAAWGSSDFLGGRHTRRSTATAVLLVAHAVGLLVLVGLLSGLGLGHLTPRAAALGAIGGVAELVGVAAAYRGLATAPARVVAPAAATAPAVPIVASALLGDPPAATTLLALAVVVGGLLVVSASGAPGDRGAGTARGLRLGAVAALGFGLGFVAIDLAVGASGHGHALAATAGVVAAGRVTTVAVLAVGWAARRVARPDARDVPGAAAIGLLIVGGDLAFATATAAASAGVASAVATCHTAVTILLAWAVDRERLSTVQLGGVTAVVAGVAMLATAP